MSNQDFGRSTSTSTSTTGERYRSKQGDSASDVYSKASDTARDTTEKVKQAAASTAHTVTDQVKELIDRQIGTGAHMAERFASSARVAADQLDRESPVMAGLVRTVANKIDDYAGTMHDQTVEQLTRSASDFTRRQPALVFGLAAVAGFFIFRTIKSGQRMASPSIQPMHGGHESWHKNT